MKVAAAILLGAAALLLAGCGGQKVSVTVKEPTTVTVITTTTAETTTAAEPQPPPPASSGVADVVARVLPSLVNVRSTTFGGDKGEGSGVVVDAKGILVTNYHVVRDSRSLTVVFNDGKHRKSLAASVVGTAPERDLAVLRVPAQDLTPITIGHSSKLRLGDGVVALGFPLGLGGPTVTSGIVSGLNRTISTNEGPSLEGLLQTDAAINPGNSGGPLVDMSGRLIGINTAAASAGYAENVGFAISIDEAKPVIEEIRAKPAAKRAWLGVVVQSVDTDADAVQLGVDASVRGAGIISVVPTSPAAKAGMREGSVVVEVDGKPIRSAADLTRVLGGYDPGDLVTLEVVDAFGPQRFTLKLIKRPATVGG